MTKRSSRRRSVNPRRLSSIFRQRPWVEETGLGSGVGGAQACREGAVECPISNTEWVMGTRVGMPWQRVLGESLQWSGSQGTGCLFETALLMRVAQHLKKLHPVRQGSKGILSCQMGQKCCRFGGSTVSAGKGQAAGNGLEIMLEAVPADCVHVQHLTVRQSEGGISRGGTSCAAGCCSRHSVQGPVGEVEQVTACCSLG